MKIGIYTINIDNYFPELYNICYPTIKQYADKIGAELTVITERKFPDLHLSYEKSQVHELGIDNDWNIVMDADIIIHPDMPDLTKRLPPYLLGIRDTYKADTVFKLNDYFFRDRRKVGVSATFVMASKYCHDFFNPLEGKQEDHLHNIIPWRDEIERGITPDHFITEYLYSINLARYGLKYSGILHENERFMLHHSYNAYTNEQKLIEAKDYFNKYF